jgi:proteasome lid subunit RPN8/RPN11
LRLLFVANGSVKPGRFEIAHSEERRARLEAGRTMKIVGAFHSHPLSAAVPSAGDIARARFGHLMLIYDVCGRDASLWLIRRLKGKKTAERVELRISGESRRRKNRTR